MRNSPTYALAVFLLTVATVGCASGSKADAPAGHAAAARAPAGRGFVRGTVGSNAVDMAGPLTQTRVSLNPAFSWLMLAPSMNKPVEGTPVTLTVVFRGRDPGTFRVLNRDTTGVTADDDVAQVMVHIAGRKWASVDGQLAVTEVAWNGKKLRRLAGTYRGRVRAPDNQVVPADVAFSYE